MSWNVLTNFVDELLSLSRTLNCPGSEASPWENSCEFEEVLDEEESTVEGEIVAGYTQ